MARISDPGHVNTWAASRGEGHPFSTSRFYALEACRRWKSCAPEYSAWFFLEPWNRSSSRNFRNTPATRPPLRRNMLLAFAAYNLYTALLIYLLTGASALHPRLGASALRQSQGLLRTFYLIQFV